MFRSFSSWGVGLVLAVLAAVAQAATVNGRQLPLSAARFYRAGGDSKDRGDRG
jgi:hypothetical protein